MVTLNYGKLKYNFIRKKGEQTDFVIRCFDHYRKYFYFCKQLRCKQSLIK